MINNDKLERVYEAKTADGKSIGLHLAKSYFDAPTFILEDANGTKIHWREDLCEAISIGREAEYWKQRALLSEKRASGYGPLGLGYQGLQNIYGSQCVPY